MSSTLLNRRRFLTALTVTSGALLAGCAPKVVEKVVKETVVVKEAVEVQKEVTRVVEKQVEVQPATPVPVKLLVHTNQQGQYYGAMKLALDKDILGWKSQHPQVTVDFDPVPGWTAEYFPRISALVAAKTLGDIVWFPPRHRNHVGWGFHYKIVADLMPFIEAANYDLKQFYPGVVESSTYEGKFYYMPLTSEPVVPVMCFNKTLVEKWGLPYPQNDWTFDELIEFGKAGTRDGVWGYHTGSQSMHPLAWGPGIRQLGGEWMSEDGKTFLPNSEEPVKWGLQYRHDLIYKHKTMPIPDPTFNTSENFAAQKVLAYDGWPGHINNQMKLAEGKGYEVDFVYTAIDKKGVRRRSMLNEHVHGVTTFSKNPDVAFDFLALIATEEVCVQNLLAGWGAPVGRADLYDDQRAIKVYPGLALLKPIMADIEPDFFVRNFRGDELDTAFQNATGLLALDKISVNECWDTIIKDCQAIIAKEPA